LATRPSGKGELVDIISPAVADPFRDSDFSAGIFRPRLLEVTPAFSAITKVPGFPEMQQGRE
jgi:hypothetical protein